MQFCVIIYISFLIFIKINIKRLLISGRPRRAKTRAPSRPITDQSQDIDEGTAYYYLIPSLD